MADLSNLLYDWKTHPEYEGESFWLDENSSIDPGIEDETLRDGIQSPTLTTSGDIADKKIILRLANDLGIQGADIGLPGAGAHQIADVTALARMIDEENLKIKPSCAARTHKDDIRPIIDISEDVGYPIRANTFLGSSRMRQYVENWEIATLIEKTRDAVRFAIDRGLPVMYVTEDTTRAKPSDIHDLYRAAIDAGAERICLCDTVGSATPPGVYKLVRYVIEEILEKQYKDEDIQVDFHGHSDRALALPNAIAAFAAGVNRVHACANGMGERAGNLAMEQILAYLVQEDCFKTDFNLKSLKEYCDTAREAFGFRLEDSQPIVGKDVFKTATGVHAAAVIKAMKKKDTVGGYPLQDVVYSGVSAGMIGREQEIGIGPMSGKANAVYLSQQILREENPGFIDELLEVAKTSKGLLSKEQITKIASRYMS